MKPPRTCDPPAPRGTALMNPGGAGTVAQNQFIANHQPYHSDRITRVLSLGFPRFAFPSCRHVSQPPRNRRPTNQNLRVLYALISLSVVPGPLGPPRRHLVPEPVHVLQKPVAPAIVIVFRKRRFPSAVKTRVTSSPFRGRPGRRSPCATGTQARSSTHGRRC